MPSTKKSKTRKSEHNIEPDYDWESSLAEDLRADKDLAALARDVDEKAVATRAYQLWVARGCPSGDGTGDWFAARRALEDERRVSTVPSQSRKRK